jgi:hypothetical protein
MNKGIYLNDIPVDLFLKYFKSSDISGNNNTFYRNSLAIRSAFNNIRNIENFLPKKFNPRCIGLVSSTNSEKLYYFDQLTIINTYTDNTELQRITLKQSQNPNIGDMWFNIDTYTLYTATLNNSWNLAIEETVGRTEEDSIKTDPSLNSEPSVGDKWFDSESRILYIATENETWDEAEEYIIANSIEEIDAFLINKISQNSGVFQETFLEYITTEVLDIKSLSVYNVTSDLILNNNGYLINNESINDSGVAIIRSSIGSNEFINYIGTVERINSTTIRLDKYVPSISDQFENEDNTSYIEDSNSNYLMKVRQQKLFFSTNDYSITEFLDYNHTVSTQADYTFTISTGSNIQYIKRGSQISTPLQLEIFRNNFNFGHQFIDGFPLSRGEEVSDSILRNMRREAVLDMAVKFLSRVNDNFVIVDNRLYDSNSFMKMRILSESYQSILLNDYSIFYTPYNFRINKINIDNTERKLILSKDYEYQSNINIKKYLINDIDRSNIISKLDDINTYQKLLDYKSFPTDDVRKNYLEDREIRNKKYQNNSSEFSFDYIENTKKIYNKKEVNRLDFKYILISDIINNFYKVDVYEEIKKGELVENKKYIQNYQNFYKGKLNGLSPQYLTLSNYEEKEKKVFNSFYINGDDEDEILEKILLSDWRVL